jgi:hypothetical protein
MARQPAGSPGLSDELTERARAWARRSSMDQHLPERVTDARALRAVAGLLGVSGGSGSDAPDGFDSVRVEPVIPATARPDNDVVENGGDDRSLSGERKVGPSLPQA